MRRAEIDEQNRYLLERQRQFRLAADIVAEAWMAFPEVWAIAVIGSVAKPLWKEVPPFREFRRESMRQPIVVIRAPRSGVRTPAKDGCIHVPAASQ